MRLAVVSPFLDRQHGTELCVVEQIERLVRYDHWQIHLYSQSVKQVEGVSPSDKSPEREGEGIFWHEISDIPGPHLLKYCWWLIANQWRRQRDRRSGKVAVDLVYSPGINCMDADVIVVHMLFHEFYERVKSGLGLRQMPLRTWPLIVHRKLYYKLCIGLENKIYINSRVHLIAVSPRIAEGLKRRFGRTDVTVIPNSTDICRFNPESRKARRDESRARFGFSSEDFVILFIGNDWKKKGLDALLRACAILTELPWRLLVVGSDDINLYKILLDQPELRDRVKFEKPSADVPAFYATADLYISSSLEDAFGLPILEAMACGLAVIASIHAGASENIRDGETGVLLREPRDHEEIAQKVQLLFAERKLREKIGEAAAQYAQTNCSWDQNARRTRETLEAALQDQRRN